MALRDSGQNFIPEVSGRGWPRRRMEASFRTISKFPLTSSDHARPRGCIRTRKDIPSSTSGVFPKAMQDCKKKHWYFLTLPSPHNSMVSNSNFELDSTLERA